MEWNINRTLSKINYKIHTDAIKENLIPLNLSKSYIGFAYASEADLLNIALFNMTAKELRQLNQDKKGNIRDYAIIELFRDELEYDYISGPIRHGTQKWNLYGCRHHS